jgi:hypothetical protein
MICFAKSGLTEDLYIVKKEEFSMASAMCARRTLDERPSTFIRDKPIFSSERMLHTDCYSKSSIEKKIFSRESQGAWRQGQLIGSKPLVVK